MPNGPSIGEIAGTPRRVMPGVQTLPEHSLIVLDTVTEGYVRFDSEFRFTFVNQAAEALLGKSRAEVLGTDPSSDCGYARQAMAAIGTPAEAMAAAPMKALNLIALEPLTRMQLGGDTQRLDSR